MNRGNLWIALVVLCAWGVAGCGGNSHHITPPPVNTSNFVFYAAGEEASGDTYSIAGVVSVTTDGTGTITGGEQDFNDGDETTSPQPSGDTILASGSSLVMDPDGSGNAILTLVTNNPNLGVSGTESFALAFSNNNHAIISQFDGTTTSTGSYDLQTLPTASLASSSFALSASGVGPGGEPIAEGGVLSVDGSGDVTGSVDINDGGTPSFANSPSVGTNLPPTDSFGRGTVTGNLDGITSVNYYIVNSEVLRIIDVDLTDTAVGSAYGQGTAQGTFSPASLTESSVFSISGIDDGFLYSGAGQFFADPTGTDAARVKTKTLRTVHPNGVADTPSFNGTADVNESIDGGPIVAQQPFSGTYGINTQGYGFFDFGDGGPTEDIVTYGIYAVDPTLNILDPNNPTGGPGGALIAEMDANLIGTGLLIPQTGTDIGDLAANVTFSAQGAGTAADGTDEFDFLGAAGASEGNFAGEGTLSDPLGALTDTQVFGVPANASFFATFVDDGLGIGRSTSGADGFTVAAIDETDFSTVTLDVTVYEANPNQLFWVETDDGFTFAGSIQSSTFTVSEAVKAQAKSKKKK